MYSSMILELLEANKESMSSSNKFSTVQRENVNGMGYQTKHEETRQLEDDDAEEYENDNNNEEFCGINDQIYMDKLSTLKAQLQHLHDGTHKEYNRKKKDIFACYKDRMKMNEVWLEFQMIMVEKEYESETRWAVEEFEGKKAELKENLQLELEDKKRIIEQERYSLDLCGDSMEYKPVSTRKLRRRGNEPLPVVEKRRKTFANSLEAVLDEQEIDEDIRKMYKNKVLNMKKRRRRKNYFSNKRKKKMVQSI